MELNRYFTNSQPTKDLEISPEVIILFLNISQKVQMGDGTRDNLIRFYLKIFINATDINIKAFENNATGFREYSIILFIDTPILLVR
jgi:hypothetical protein